MWYFVKIIVLLDYVESITIESTRDKVECTLCCCFCWLLKKFLKLLVLFKFCEFICIVCRQ